jgi:hypothetical protein
MKGLWKALKDLASGGPERAAGQPLIAGYHRSLAPGVMVAGALILAAACFVYGFYFSVMAPARIMPFTVPLALLGGLVVWALPAGSYAPTRALEPIYFAFFAALIVWPNYLAVALPGLPWMTMLRLTVVPLILVFLVCLSVSPTFRTKLADVMSGEPYLWRMFVILVAIQTATLAMSNNLPKSINLYIIAQMNWTMIFLVGVVVFTRRGFTQHWATMLIVMLTGLCFLGLWENQLKHVPWAGHIPTIFKIEDEAVLRVLAGGMRSATKIYRVQATATTPLGLAEILGLATPFALHFMLDRYNLALRILGAFYIPLSVHLILLTDSRLGLIATLGSLMVYLLIWAFIQWRQRKTSLIGPTVVLTYPLIAIATLAATLFVGRLRNEIWGDGSQNASNESRRIQWDMAIPKILKNPIGHGTGKGGDTLGFANAAGVGTIDSYYITIFLELGVLGFIVYYGIMLRGAWVAANVAIRSPLERELRLLIPFSVALVNYVIVKSVLSQDANHPLVFMMLGAVVALTYRARQQEAAQAAGPAGAHRLEYTAKGWRAAPLEREVDKRRKANTTWFRLLVTLVILSMITYVILIGARGLV